jgi:hypothetical protein
VGVTVGGFLASWANAAVPLVDRLRGGAYPLRVGSNSKPGAGSAAEESKAVLGSQGAAPSGGPRAGATHGGGVGSPRGWRSRVTEAVAVTKARIRLRAPRADRPAETPRRCSPAASPPGRWPMIGAPSLRRAPPSGLAAGTEPSQRALAPRCPPPSPSLAPALGRWAPAPRVSFGGAGAAAG